MLGFMCLPNNSGESVSFQITNPSVYRARSDERRDCCTDRGRGCQKQHPEMSSNLRSLLSRVVSYVLFGGHLS